MPNVLPKQAIEEADAAVAFAQQVRKFHRRRTNRTDPRRANDIALARERLADAMVPLRSEIGRFAYGPQTDIAEHNRTLIREASERIQVERRKLTKMTAKSK
jgi:hypothetical protein